MAKNNENRAPGPRRPKDAGQAEIAPAIWERISSHFTLSPRELEVAQLLFGALKETAIARRLKMSLGTLKKTAQHLYQKMGVHNRHEFGLSVFALYQQFTKEPLK